MTEYECYGSFEINFSSESMGKLKSGEIKKLLKKTLEDYFEKYELVCSYDVSDVEDNLDYEKLEE